MNARELIEAIAKETGYTRVQIKAVLEAEARLQSAALEGGADVTSLLGRFEVTDRPERQGRNPRTGEQMTIAARKVVKFRPRVARDKNAGSDEASSAR